MNSEPQKRTSILSGALLFVLLLGATLFLLLREQSLPELGKVLRSVRTEYIVAAGICSALFITFSGANISNCLKLLDYSASAAQAAKYALAGFFFSSVTPSASGGQPMQLFYMKADGVTFSNGTLCLLLEFLSYQSAAVLLALFALVFCTLTGFAVSANMRTLLLVGVLLNTLTLLLTLILIFSKRLSRRLIELADKLLHALRLKAADAISQKLYSQLESYQQSAEVIRTKLAHAPKLLCTSAMQLTSLYAVAGFVYLAFDLPPAQLPEVLALQAILYISVSALPLPGAVGASEGGFVILYKQLFGMSLLNGAMLLSRAMSFYLPVAVSGISMAIYALLAKKRKRTAIK